MTPEITADNTIEPQKQAPSTAGMTTKVVKGSMWTLAGSVAPLAISFISTPFIIRFLGTESYGVLLLVGLIPTYFSFADFGMGVASTKFAAEAYGEGDEKKEAEIVWTATAIAAISALIVAIPIFLFSYPIVKLMNVPEHLLSTASIALKITSGSFFLGILSSVLNSPMLARLRMDLNMLTQSTPKVLLAVVTPILLYLGAGIIEVVGWGLIVSIGALGTVIYASKSLHPPLSVPVFNREWIKPLMKFGFGLVVGGLAAVLLVNFEKIVLTRFVSVTALAHYSVAFTFAGMATMFSNSMLQSLGPAFARLNGDQNRAQFDSLFSRGMSLNIIWLLPALTFLFVIAKPFFTLWAGEEFGRESTVPFYILLGGLFFNILAYIPFSTISAKGRTDIFAKLYWLEFFLYAIAAVALVKWFGIVGAAAAFTLRVTFDAFAIIFLARRIANVPLDSLLRFRLLVPLIAVLLPPIVLTIFSDFSLLLVVLLTLSVIGYAWLVWVIYLDDDERRWGLAKIRGLRGYYRP